MRFSLSSAAERSSSYNAGSMIFRFAGFSVDSDTRLLLAGGTEVHLSPKAFTLLLTLIEHRSRVVSKSELQERIWPATFVGEESLPTLVAEVRRALGDSAQDSRFLRTVHRVGYRFVGAIEDEAPPRREGGAAHMYLTTADRQFALAEGATIIGRGHDAGVRIDSGGVSRHHARIVVRADAASLEDLSSKNGTFLDGKAVSGSCVLQDGNEIRVGPVALTFRIAPPTRATETMR
jgi:DNA-binding winged helix-turn-helix (wHTH) protein